MAEKFEAIVSLGLVNSRYKDFYDIYVLSLDYALSGTELQNAIMETFQHRKTNFDDIVAFEEGFAEDTVRQNRWNAFVKKKKTMVKVEFKEVIGRLHRLLMPVVEMIKSEKAFEMKWNPEKGEWE